MSIGKVMVAGAGIMGSGIAQVCIEHGISTLLVDISKERADKGAANIEHFLQRKIEKGRIKPEEKEAALKLLKTSGNYADGKDADIVVEAATENMEIKQKLFAQLDETVNENAILCTNTSSMSITQIAGAARHPERVVGTHFFMPVPAMRLLEIIPGILTSEKTVEKAMEFGQMIEKVTVKAPDTAGFLVNRIFEPMRNEAIYLVMEGNSPEDVDTAMKLGCNWPMGPLELADYTGLDTLLASMTRICEETGDPKYRHLPFS